MNTTEIWKDIEGYEGFYQVSNYGRVRSLDRDVYYLVKGKYKTKRTFYGQILALVIDEDGYYIVCLNKNGEHQNKRVNVLVAKAFIPNPLNKPYVGHLKTLPNGLEDKTANEAWNLAWMTPEENSNYGTLPTRRTELLKKLYKEGKMKKVWEGKKRPNHAEKLSIPIIEIKEDGSIVEWKSISTCAEILGCSAPHLTNAVNGKNHKRGHCFRKSKFYKKSEYEEMLAGQSN